MLYIIKEHVYFYAKLGVTIRCASSSSINGSDEILRCQLSPLSCVRSIEDGALRFRHVAREEEVSHNACRLIFIECSRYSHMSAGVHQAHLISSVITPQIND